MHDLPGFGVWISGGVDEDGELLVSGLLLVTVVRWMHLLLFFRTLRSIRNRCLAGLALDPSYRQVRVFGGGWTRKCIFYGIYYVAFSLPFP